MKLIIDIPDEAYDWIKNGFTDDADTEFLINAVKFGIVFPEGVLPDGVVYSPKLYTGCAVCNAHGHCPDAFCDHSVHCGAYGKVVPDVKDGWRYEDENNS